MKFNPLFIGITENIEQNEKRRLILINVFTIIGVFVNVLYFFFLFFMGKYLISLFNLSCGIILGSIGFYLMKSHKYRTAAIFNLIAIPPVLLAFNFIYGDLNFNLIYLMFIISTFFVLENKKTIYLIVAWVLAAFTFMNIGLATNLIKPLDDETAYWGNIFYWSNLFVGFFCTVIMVAVFKSENLRYEKLLHRNNKQISRQNEEIRSKNEQLQNYNSEIIAQQVEISAQKKKSDELLLNILPSETAEELKLYGHSDAKTYDMVSVLFTDFKDFTKISEKLSAEKLVAELDYCFKAFDRIIGKHNVEKIKTIGDSYMCAGGIPKQNTTNPSDVVKCGIEMQHFIEAYKKVRMKNNEPYFELRIGIHTGHIVAGIVGLKKFAYDIWGDTVNIASRMESSGEVGKVNISGATYELVKDNFICTYRGKVEAKNKGEIDMYFVEGVISKEKHENTLD